METTHEFADFLLQLRSAVLESGVLDVELHLALQLEPANHMPLPRTPDDDVDLTQLFAEQDAADNAGGLPSVA